MRFIKVASAAVLGILFFGLVQPANADSTHASARLANNSSNEVFFQFGISQIPDNIGYDNSLTLTLSSPSCGGSTGSGIPAISCGNYHPAIQVCWQDNTPTTPIVGCINPLITRKYDGGGNLTQWYYADISRTSTTGYFNNNFQLQGDNYYSAFIPNLSNCGSSLTYVNCSYWVQYWNASENQWWPYAATGVPLSYLSSAYWTPETSTPTPTPTPTPTDNSICTDPTSCVDMISNPIKNSIIGQAIQIYQDFFSFSYESAIGGNTGQTGIVSWKNVNPYSSDCEYLNVPSETLNLPTGVNQGFHTMGTNVPVTAKCCVGPLIKLPAIQLDPEYEYSLNYKAHFSTDKYVAPFNACSSRAQYISTTYVLPVENALVYIGFAFLMARLLLDIFGLGSNADVIGSTFSSANQVRGTIRRVRNNRSKKKGK